MARVTIIGGGTGGYEAALVAQQLGAEVTVVDRDGLGGSAVLTDCVPSKTLIRTARAYHDIKNARAFGLPAVDVPPVDFRLVKERPVGDRNDSKT